MEANQVAHIGMVSVEIGKEVVMDGRTVKVRYQLLIPLGVKWDDAELAIDELKAAMIDMRKQAAAREEAEKARPIEALVEPAATE